MTDRAPLGAARPLLEVAGLRVDFHTRRGPVRAVDGVSLSVARGESLAIVGESGSGKSVTAMAIVGLVPQPPARVRADTMRIGETDLAAADATDLASVRGGRVGFVFQDPLAALNPVMRIGRQIGESVELHLNASRAESERRAVEWLGRVGVPDPAGIARAYPHQLSGGMRQRVMIAISLAGEPELLIADEPTTALDVTVQAQIIALVQELQQELRMALIWISHDLGVVAGLADRVAVMRQGRIVESAPVDRLYASPEDQYTQRLIALARRSAAGLPGAGGPDSRRTGP